MGLFDAFSSSAGKQYANKAYQAETQGIDQATGYVNQGANTQLGYVNPAYNTAKDAIQQAHEGAYGAINNGTNQAAGYYNQALSPWQTLTNIGTEGLNRYGDVVGLNGQAAATAAYQGSPGFLWEMQQGQEALDRTANSRGMLASGNNTEDILKYSQGVAGQDYYKYLQALQPYFGVAQNGASGLSNAYNTLGNLYANQGTQLANLDTNYGSNIANLATGHGTQDAAIAGQQYRSLANLATQQGQYGADKYANYNNADQTANSNLWGAILGLGGAAANVAGQAAGAPTYNFA